MELVDVDQQIVTVIDADEPMPDGLGTPSLSKQTEGEDQFHKAPHPHAPCSRLRAT